MKSMTYGVMPTKKVFHEAWEREMGERSYSYTLRGEDAESARFANVPTQGQFREWVLYDIIRKLRNAFNRGDENAGSVASSILSTLGFEWI